MHVGTRFIQVGLVASSFTKHYEYRLPVLCAAPIPSLKKCLLELIISVRFVRASVAPSVF